ncbi:MAG: acyltransferase [Hyphomonadaceae bacterium]|nr:acyltransferase [Hyphomonadaceae bacterium]
MQAKAHNEHLDAVRAIAALLVLAANVRITVLVDFSELPVQGLVEAAFYAVTSLGHVAVLTFFALSGYLVGGRALTVLRRGQWSWSSYLLRRLTRLWIVVLPALGLTWCLDLLSARLNSEGVSMFLEHFGLPQYDHSSATLIGNIFFLQTILTPTFGSDAPLWSLANEFWYYLIFPLALVPFFDRRRWRLNAAVSAASLALAAAILPLKLILLGLIWLAGVAASMLAQTERLHAFLRHPGVRVVGLALIPASIAYARLPGELGQEFVLGLAMSAALPVLAHLPSFGAAYKASAARLAGISYTLYLVHFPVILFIVTVWITPHQWAFGPTGLAVFASVFAAALAAAWGVWWLFERHTDAVYAALSGRAASSRNGPLPGVGSPGAVDR